MNSTEIIFPGSNCDKDIASALEKYQIKNKMLWHNETVLPKTDLVVLPGGFSFGDYLRTGAIASKYLAKNSISNVGIVGAGAQAKFQLEALLLVKKPKEIRLWARSENSAKAYIAEINKKYNFKTFICKTVQEVTENSEIVISTTPSKEPLIKAEWLHPGLQITAMGSDAEHKNEIDPQIIATADLYVCDRQSQTSILGELHHAIKKGIVDKNKEYTEVGEIINGTKKGRKSDQEIIICDLTGTGVQDTAIARFAFEKAVKNKMVLEV